MNLPFNSLPVFRDYFHISVQDSHLILRQGCDVSIKELESLLSLLMEKKRKMEQEEAETNLQILLEFLQCLRKQKVEELYEVLS